MLGLSRCQKQHPTLYWDWQIKGVVLPRHGGFNGWQRGFYLRSRTQRHGCWLGAGRAALCPSCHLSREGLVCCRAARIQAEQALFPSVAKGNQVSPPTR